MTSDLDDFRSMFDAAYPRVVAYACRRVTDANAADDVVAETFLVAWRRRVEVVAMDDPLPWLYGVAANQIRNQSRGANRRLRLVAKASADPTAVASSESSSSDESDLASRIRAALAELSFDDQEVLRLVTWEELTYAQAAQVLDCSVDAVGQRIRRAKQRLSQVLEHQDSASDDAEPQPDPPSSPTLTTKVSQP